MFRRTKPHGAPGRGDTAPFIRISDGGRRNLTVPRKKLSSPWEHGERQDLQDGQDWLGEGILGQKRTERQKRGRRREAGEPLLSRQGCAFHRSMLFLSFCAAHAKRSNPANLVNPVENVLRQRQGRGWRTTGNGAASPRAERGGGRFWTGFTGWTELLEGMGENVPDVAVSRTGRARRGSFWKTTWTTRDNFFQEGGRPTPPALWRFRLCCLSWNALSSRTVVAFAATVRVARAGRGYHGTDATESSSAVFAGVFAFHPTFIGRMLTFAVAVGVLGAG